jgi:hypothetical protein
MKRSPDERSDIRVKTPHIAFAHAGYLLLSSRPIDVHIGASGQLHLAATPVFDYAFTSVSCKPTMMYRLPPLLGRIECKGLNLFRHA